MNISTLNKMNSENWVEEYKTWKDLEPFQISLLENGADTLSQSWLINSMWCEWKDIKKQKETCVPTFEKYRCSDPWED